MDTKIRIIGLSYHEEASSLAILVDAKSERDIHALPEISVRSLSAQKGLKEIYKTIHDVLGKESPYRPVAFSFDEQDANLEVYVIGVVDKKIRDRKLYTHAIVTHGQPITGNSVVDTKIREGFASIQVDGPWLKSMLPDVFTAPEVNRLLIDIGRHPLDPGDLMRRLTRFAKRVPFNEAAESRPGYPRKTDGYTFASSDPDLLASMFIRPH